MRLLIIEETEYRKQGQTIAIKRDVKEINIPEEVLQRIKQDFEAWLKEEKKNGN